MEVYMKHWKYIMLDLDGTLSDNQEGILNCVRYALEGLGQRIPSRETLMSFIGPPLKEGFEQVCGMDPELADKAVVRYRERYHRVGLYENQMYEGIPQLLTLLREHGFHLAVATSKPEPFTRDILKYFGILDQFEVVCGSLLDGTRDQKALVIEAVLERFGLKEDLSQVLMVGDRRHDVIGARQFGIPCLAVRYGFAPAGELEQAGADYIVDTVEQIGDFLINNQ